jgi:hypothetical protein
VAAEALGRRRLTFGHSSLSTSQVGDVVRDRRFDELAIVAPSLRHLLGRTVDRIANVFVREIPRNAGRRGAKARWDALE